MTWTQLYYSLPPPPVPTWVFPSLTNHSFMDSRLICQHTYLWTSQVALVIKNPPANAGRHETQVWSLRGENPLEEGMASHSSILPGDSHRGAWQATVHRVTQSRTWLSDLGQIHKHVHHNLSHHRFKVIKKDNYNETKKKKAKHRPRRQLQGS